MEFGKYVIMFYFDKEHYETFSFKEDQENNISMLKTKLKTEKVFVDVDNETTTKINLDKVLYYRITKLT